MCQRFPVCHRRPRFLPDLPDSRLRFPVSGSQVDPVSQGLPGEPGAPGPPGHPPAGKLKRKNGLWKPIFYLERFKPPKPLPVNVFGVYLISIFPGFTVILDPYPYHTVSRSHGKPDLMLERSKKILSWPCSSSDKNLEPAALLAFLSKSRSLS